MRFWHLLCLTLFIFSVANAKRLAIRVKREVASASESDEIDYGSIAEDFAEEVEGSDETEGAGEESEESDEIDYEDEED